MFQVIKTSDDQALDVFLNVYEDIPGGLSLLGSELPTDMEEVKQGALLSRDTTDDKKAHLVKTGTVHEASTSTTLKLTKAHAFVVGDFISNGEVSTAITVIDKSNATFDTVTLTAAMVVTQSQAVYQGSSETTNVAVSSSAQVEDVVAATLTLTNPYGENGMKVTIEQNSSDNLSVSAAGGNLVIKLANTTATKNTAALIQTAIRAKEQTGGVNWNQVSCAVGGTWDTAALGAVLTVASDTFAGGTPHDGADRVVGLDPKYKPDSVLKNTANVKDAAKNSANIFVSGVVRGSINEASLTYPVPSGFKSMLSDRVRFE